MDSNFRGFVAGIALAPFLDSGGKMENMQSGFGEEQYRPKELEAPRIEEIIENDHQEIEGRLSALIKGSGMSVNDRRALLNEVRHEILQHMAAEEHCFYPAIEKIEGVKAGQVRESEQEHHQIRILLEELDDVAVEDPDWCAKLRVLCEDLQHHHREEEEEFLSRTKDAWSDKKSEEISSEFLKVKKQVNL